MYIGKSLVFFSHFAYIDARRIRIALLDTDNPSQLWCD
ncbi:hypothetical protein PAMC26577_21645 [Caballeronia sordidicola]|uniref:Uncharacterized protein n=1 Tax=Caballeronia sordidicola TaxID=196367 RepID=A0A242MLG8_CABSO|nr:hypothetical protein PAMC26577_21645 [Caballeronia sordidicola]